MEVEISSQQKRRNAMKDYNKTPLALDRQLSEQLKVLAAQEQRTIQSLIRWVLSQYVKQHLTNRPLK